MAVTHFSRIPPFVLILPVQRASTAPAQAGAPFDLALDRRTHLKQLCEDPPDLSSPSSINKRPTLTVKHTLTVGEFEVYIFEDQTTQE